MNKRQLLVCISLLFLFAAAGCERPQTGDFQADLALQAFNTIIKEHLYLTYDDNTLPNKSKLVISVYAESIM